MAGQFDGKVALVTGGSSGIGRAAAVAFAREGARVAVAARREAESLETVARIHETGSEAVFIQTDVSDEAQVEAMVAGTVNAFGRLDFAFNNAGVSQRGAGAAGPLLLHELPTDVWDRLMAINLRGVFLCLKYEINQMIAQGAGGAIVNDSSVSGLVGVPHQSAYSASKHGVLGLTKAAALGAVQQGIRVNAVCPGWIRTPMVEVGIANLDGFEERITAMEPIGRIGDPGEIADAVIWLCSDQASFMVGHSLVVDGGMMAGVVS